MIRCSGYAGQSSGRNCHTFRHTFTAISRNHLSNRANSTRSSRQRSILFATQRHRIQWRRYPFAFPSDLLHSASLATFAKLQQLAQQPCTHASRATKCEAQRIKQHRFALTETAAIRHSLSTNSSSRRAKEKQTAKLQSLSNSKHFSETGSLTG